MADATTSLFPLPDTQVLEVVWVRLDDGRVVARSPEELAQLPADQMPEIISGPSL